MAALERIQWREVLEGLRMNDPLDDREARGEQLKLLCAMGLELQRIGDILERNGDALNFIADVQQSAALDKAVPFVPTWTPCERCGALDPEQCECPTPDELISNFAEVQRDMDAAIAKWPDSERPLREQPQECQEAWFQLCRRQEFARSELLNYARRNRVEASAGSEPPEDTP
jgi:hypothetical protein